MHASGLIVDRRGRTFRRSIGKTVAANSVFEEHEKKKNAEHVACQRQMLNHVAPEVVNFFLMLCAHHGKVLERDVVDDVMYTRVGLKCLQQWNDL
eukprot:6065889-Amphidinium_carterae.2